MTNVTDALKIQKGMKVPLLYHKTVILNTMCYAMYVSILVFLTSHLQLSQSEHN